MIQSSLCQAFDTEKHLQVCLRDISVKPKLFVYKVFNNSTVKQPSVKTGGCSCYVVISVRREYIYRFFNFSAAFLTIIIIRIRKTRHIRIVLATVTAEAIFTVVSDKTGFLSIISDRMFSVKSVAASATDIKTRGENDFLRRKIKDMKNRVYTTGNTKSSGS